MVDPELTQYIKSMKDSGFSDEETRKKLFDAGWDAKDVNEALGTGPAPVAATAPAAATAVATAPAAKATPSSGMAYQGIGIRFAAQLIDGIILLFIYFILAMPLALVFSTVSYGGGYDSSGPLSLLLNLILIVISFGYFVLLEGSRGQTVGKMVCGIKVVKEDGSPCDLGAALIRNILRMVDGIMVYLVGVVLIASSDTKQRLGDRVAKTVVVKK